MGGAGDGPNEDGHGDGHGGHGPHGPGMVHALMEPLLFDGCYGWLHRPIVPLAPLALFADPCGVVLCNPFGQEAIMTCTVAGATSPRCCPPTACRRCASTTTAPAIPMATRAIPPGCRRGRPASWPPCAVLRELTGVTRVALCGIRLGALLAVLATQEMEAEAMTRWCCWRRWCGARPSARTARVAEHRAGSSPADQLDPAETEDFMTVVGNRFYRDTIDAIQTCDLGKPGQLHQRPAARMLILSASTLDGAGRLAESAAALGCDVTQAPFDEYETYVSYPELNDLPWQAFRHATAWLAGVPETDVREPDNARVRRLSADDAPVLHGDRFVERRAHYGADGLFGILCEPPAAARGDGAPVVLIISHRAPAIMWAMRAWACSARATLRGAALRRCGWIWAGLATASRWRCPADAFSPTAATCAAT